MTRKAVVPLLLITLLVATEGATETVRIVADRTEVRREASPVASVLGAVTKGTILTVLGHQGGWVRVAYPISDAAFYAGFVPTVFCEDAQGAAPSAASVVATSTSASTSSGPAVGASTPAPAPTPIANTTPSPTTPKPSQVNYSGRTVAVRIIDRQDSSGSYTYVVPGFSTANSTTTVNCNAYGNSANCSGSTGTTGFATPGFAGSYEVRGATLSLLLPDGRVAVVNCLSKFNWTDWSNPGMYRSCRIPMVPDIQAEFDGDKAKLKWSVSLDGKKMQTETYKVLAILEKR